MGADRRRLPSGVRVRGFLERLGEAEVLPPARLVVKVHRATQQRVDRTLPVGDDAADGDASPVRDGLSRFGELSVPDPGARETLTAQGGIALLQRALVARPLRREPMFHVEHGPVEPATAVAGALLDQAMDVGVQGLHGPSAREFGERFDPCPVEAATGRVRDLDAERVGNRSVGPAEDDQSRPSMPDQLVRVARAEGPPPPEQVRRLEERSLAGPVRPPDDVDSGVKRQLRPLDAAQVLDEQVRERHDLRALPVHRRRQARAGPYSRIGMTTYLAPVVPGARMRQLLLESVSPISTRSVSIADSASRR